MKQAIQEGFILDVLAHYTPVASYYRFAKTVEDDPEFDVRKAQKKLRRFVEGHDHAIRLKAEIMVDHFHEQVLARNKIGGEARAMVVTNGIERAIQYFHAIRDYAQERKSNPTCEQVGEKHKHRWSERYGDKEAYVPVDVSAPASNPVAVWREFCAEARIRHDGRMRRPSATQAELW